MKIFLLTLLSFLCSICFAQKKTAKESQKVLGLFFDSINYTTVKHVVLGGAADKAMFYMYDKITKVNNVSVQQTNRANFIKYLSTLPDKINFEIERGGKTVQLSATKTVKESFLNKCVLGNCQNGNGTYTYSDYSSFIGEFKDGKKIKGTWAFLNGDYYVGNIVNDKFEGQGQYQFWYIKKGQYTSWNEYFYKGEFKNGKFEGEGDYKSTEFNYIGTFKVGKRQGQGWIRWKNDTEYKGEFANDKVNGIGILEKRNYFKYEGEFINGNKNGKGKFYELSDGRIEKVFDEVWSNGILVTKTAIDPYTKQPTSSSSSAKNKINDYTPNADDVHLGIAILWVGSGASGPTTFYLYNIYGKPGERISVKDEDALRQKVNALYYKMNEFQREENQKKVLQITFDRGIDEDVAVKIIKDSGGKNDVSITDIDIYKKGKFVLGRN